MKHITNLILFLAIFISNQSWSQDLSFDQKSIYFPDKIVTSKFKKGYTKENSKVPKKYRDKTEEDDFFGGESAAYLKNFDLKFLLNNNQKYVHIPTNSYIVFEFEKGLKNFENTPDLIIESCIICGCGKPGIDSAMISVSRNNINYKDLLIVKNHGNYQVDFDDFEMDEIKFIKIKGLSAIAHPYGYGLMNIYGFSKKPEKLIEPIISDIKQKKEKNEIIVVQDMLFEFNDSLIKNEEINELDSICSILIYQEFDSLIISGHTDSIGNNDYNLQLSLGRASSIANFLIDCGIPKNKIKIVGYGESRLLIDINGDDSRNRRVEIEIIKDE